MRDLLLMGTLIALVPAILRMPQIGILTWIWVTLFNPQREVYGVLRGAELNFYIALLTAFAWSVSKERKHVPFNPLAVPLVAFAIWISITTFFALDAAYSGIIWERTIKTIVLSLSVIAIATNKVRVQSVIWLIVISLGYYAVKGGGFVLLTGGGHHVYGPAKSMIEDNNSLALALVLLLPLLQYLRVTARSAWIAFGCLGTMGFTLIAIVGTYSRGALVALAATGAAYFVKSRSGAIPLLLAGVVAISLPSLVPASWFQRMASIQSYDEDASFAGRVAAWKTSLAIAKDRPLIGGGFSAVDLDWVAQRYHSSGSLRTGKAAHSIYFEVLGDHGFVGLVIYLLIVATAWLNTATVLRKTRDDVDMDWANRLARMLQVSMVGYLVGGAALSMAYYDGFFLLLALTAALALSVGASQVDAQTPERVPRWKQLGSARTQSA